MKKNNWSKAMLLSVLVLMLVGCTKVVVVDKPNETTQPAVTEPANPPTPNQDPSAEAYEGFLNNEFKISFDRIMPLDTMGEELYKMGNDYTLSEVLAVLNGAYFEKDSNSKVQSMEYSYMDSGMDGVKELVLRFNGMDIYGEADDSTLVYVIKAIDEKLYLCYFYETWARSFTSLNEYGYCQSEGSGGASYHMIEYSQIDQAGKWQFIASIEMESNINQFASLDELSQIPEVAATKELTGNIELNTLRLDDIRSQTDQNSTLESFYTYYVYDNNQELIKDENLYTHSVYQEIFDEAKVPFITPDEVERLISEKEKKMGITPEVKNGKELTWKSLNIDMF